MNKSELITAVSDASGLSRADATRAVQSLLGTITQRLQQGERVVLEGFGTFDRTERAARTGRNPRSGEPLQIPARKAVRFRASRNLKQAVEG